MRWLERLGLTRSNVSGRWSDGWAATADGLAHVGRSASSGVKVTPATAVQLPSVYRCCSLISDSLAPVEMRVVQESDDGGKTSVEADAARALQDWSVEDRELFLFSAALGGNGFGILRKNARGGITAIESVAPRRVTALCDSTGTRFFSIMPEEGPAKGEPEIIPASDVLHMRYRNIGNRVGKTVFGIAPIVSATEALGLILKSREFQAALWKNGALPIGYLTTPATLKQPVIERLRSQWVEMYTGEFTGKTAILEAGLTWNPVKPGILGSDSDLVNHARFGVEEIARLYGVPPSLLGQTVNASYSTAVEESRALVLHCLRPMAARFADCIGRALLTRQQRLAGQRVEISLNDLLVSPGKETAEYLKELVGAGILSTNECRNYLGYEDIAGGEVHRVPVNSTALENLPKIGLNNQTPKVDTP